MLERSCTEFLPEEATFLEVRMGLSALISRGNHIYPLEDQLAVSFGSELMA
jgi:hypothetical protein